MELISEIIWGKIPSWAESQTEPSDARECGSRFPKQKLLCSSQSRICLFQQPGRIFKGSKENGIYKSSAGSIGNKSVHTAGIPGVAPEYLAAGMHTVLNHLPSEATSSRIS